MNSTIPSLIIRVFALALSYLVTAKLSGLLAEPPGFAAPVWPAAGIALGALCVWGFRVWPGVLLGSFLYNLNTAVAAQDVVEIGRAFAIALGIAAGATLQGIIGALLVLRFVGDPDTLEDPRDIVRFLMAGGPVSCVINATCSVGLLIAAGVIPDRVGAVSWLTWWIGDAIGVLIFAPFFMILFGASRDAWKPRRFTVMLPLTVFLAILVFAFGILRQRESDALRVQLAHDADAFTRNVSAALDGRIAINQTVATLYAVNPVAMDPNRDNFLESASRRLIASSGIAWAPRVRRMARDAYEEQSRGPGLAQFEIHERTVRGTFIRAADRSEYFPVRDVASRDGMKDLAGYDLASEDVHATALISARDGGISVIAPPLWEDMGSSLLITPVFAKGAQLDTLEQRRAQLLGFVLAPLRIADVVNTVLRNIPEDRLLHIRVTETPPTGDKTPLYFGPRKHAYSDSNYGATYHTQMHFGGRTWDAVFLPSDRILYKTTWGGWYRYALLVGGLLIVSLVGALLLIITARERHLAMIGQAVAGIGRGDHATRIAISKHGPLRSIQQGINEMAEGIEKSHAELERRVYEATVELRAKKEESDAATLAKSRVLAYASHDLRQPLHALELFVAHLKEQPLNYETAKLVANVDSCVNALEGLLEGLLDLSQFDSGLVQPAPQAVAVSKLWERLRSALGESAASKKLELRFHPSTFWVMSDAHLLYRILMNLISNAIRYTSRGGVLVACRRSGNHTRLEVWDTGAGISPQHRDDIFKEFVQLDNPERDRSKGLGLGLSIVERAARVLNHRLAMRSVRGRGSCFSLEVPIADPVTSGALPAETHAQRFTFADCTVLVVEDDSLSRRALVDLLRSWNCIVVETRTAEEAQRALAEYCRPDVIASDFRLPKQQSGIDVVLQARTTLGYEVAAFIMSGDTDADVIATAKSVYLPLLHKPVQAARLRTMLRLLLKSSRTRKA